MQFGGGTFVLMFSTALTGMSFSAIPRQAHSFSVVAAPQPLNVYNLCPAFNRNSDGSWSPIQTFTMPSGGSGGASATIRPTDRFAVPNAFTGIPMAVILDEKCLKK
jgi:hypothetical protein